MASMKQVLGVIGVSILIVGLIGFWVESKQVPTETPLLANNDTLPAPLVAEELEINHPDITNSMNSIATVETNKGIIKLELFEDQMPITTGNFIKLANEGFYNNTKFHRVIDGFMIQGGDPNTKTANVQSYGTGGPGYTIQDEFVAGELLTNTRGTIAMANTGQPNSGGSQFFINTIDNTQLDFDKPPFTSRHPVFGRVIEGMDIVDAISGVEVNPQSNLPLEAITISGVTITKPDAE